LSGPTGGARAQRRGPRAVPVSHPLRHGLRHTGNFPGYVQFAAATADGRRAVTTSLNIPAPSGRLLARLRSVQVKAVCSLLR